MTRGDMEACVQMLRRYWPHARPPSPDDLVAWELLWLDLDAAVAAAAILAVAEEGGRWPPTPGEVRRRTLDLERPIPAAEEAWGEVQTQIARVGSLRGMLDYGSGERLEPVWSHSLVGETVDRIGWQALCESTTVMADRAHFLRVWSDAAARSRTAEHLAPAARALLESRGVRLPSLLADRALGAGGAGGG